MPLQNPTKKKNASRITTKIQLHVTYISEMTTNRMSTYDWVTVNVCVNFVSEYGAQAKQSGTTNSETSSVGKKYIAEPYVCVGTNINTVLLLVKTLISTTVNPKVCAQSVIVCRTVVFLCSLFARDKALNTFVRHR